MAPLAAVEAGPGGKQKWHRITAAKLHRLLRVGVVDTVFVDPEVAVGPVIGPQGLLSNVKRLGPVGQRFEPGRAAEFQEISDKIASLLRGKRGHDVLRHERADVLAFLDLGGRNAMGLPRGVDERHGLRRLFLDDSLQGPAVGGGDGKRAVFRLHVPVGPEERLDDLLGREALGDGGELRAHDAPLPGDLVA